MSALRWFYGTSFHSNATEVKHPMGEIDKGYYVEACRERDYWREVAQKLGVDYYSLKTDITALLKAAKLTSSAIRNLEGQPIQYSLAKDLSTALMELSFAIDRMELRGVKEPQ